MFLWIVIIVLMAIIIALISHVLNLNNQIKDKERLEEELSNESQEWKRLMADVDILDLNGVDVKEIIDDINLINQTVSVTYVFPEQPHFSVLRDKISKVQAELANGTAKMKPKLGIKIDPETTKQLQGAASKAGKVLLSGAKNLWTLGKQFVQDLQKSTSQAPSNPETNDPPPTFSDTSPFNQDPDYPKGTFPDDIDPFNNEV